MSKKKIVTLSVILVLVIIIIAFFKNIINFIVNIEWFSEVGYLKVYFTKVTAALKLMIPIFVICFAAIYIYYKSMKKSIAKWKVMNDGAAESKGHISKIFIFINLVISFLISYGFSTAYWYRILQFTNSSNYNVKDPIFNIDVSFYVFKLPLIESLYGIAISILVLLIVLTIIIYLVLNAKDKIFSKNSTGNVFKIFGDFNYIKSGITRFAGKQIAVIALLLMLLLSVGFVIKCFNLVYSSRGVVFGAGYTDVHVSLVFNLIIAAACIVSAVVIFISILKVRIKPIVISVLSIIVLVIIEGISYVAVERLMVKSNQQTLENKYIKYNIDYTRKAFNIDKTDVKAFEVKNDLKKDDISSNKDIISNIKVNSYKQALEFYNQVQVIRNYYTFNDIDVDRYKINGIYNQVFLAPREIDINSLEGSANIWQNRHLVYTHGYGLVMNKVNSVTSEGQPDFVMNDIPTKNATDIKISNPRIYFGEKTNDYAVVNTTLGEFDYPKGGENQENKYNGNAGIKMSFLNKLIFAAHEKDVNFLLSRYITSDSKILINRNIMDRVKKIAPFLTYDKDPYSIVYNGKIYWIIDAYTTSDKYPYSEPYNESGTNYIRNSVKVVVDAFDGTTNFYIVDKSDPIAKSYSKIFPSLFKDASSLPSELKEHFRYPQDIFDIQCSVLGKYHVTDPGIFFNGEDMWQVSVKQTDVDTDKKASNESSYVVMKLPDEQKNEMVLLEYFDMKNKNNMVGMLGARMDGDNYGKLVMYKFPTDKTIYSPYLFKQNINQDTEISKELTLWNAQGSEVQFGDTVIVPINNSLLYVEPLYLRAKGKNSIPEMKKIIVSYGDKIVSADSIDNAFSQIFGSNNQDGTNNGTASDNTQNNASGSTDQSNGDKNNTDNNTQNMKQAKDLYDKAIEAQKAGDWTSYGKYIKELGDLLGNSSK